MGFYKEKNIKKARRVLIEITSLLDANDIPYKLEGSTLLGLVRSGDLLHWDHDLDISIGIEDAKKFDKLRKKLILKGYRITKHISEVDNGPILKGNPRIFKVKPLWKSLIKILIPPVENSYVVLDIFVKASDKHHTYWQAMGKIFKVDKKYYSSTEEISYRSRQLKTLAYPEEYLTEKYGDWITPVKDWNCATDEKATF